ncbi:hypothetical protein NFI96_028261, partial [Prochilodus magdalenae]
MVRSKGVKTETVRSKGVNIRASPTRKVGLSPYEIITGRPMSLPGTIDLRQADVHLTSDALLKYCEELTDS